MKAANEFLRELAKALRDDLAGRRCGREQPAAFLDEDVVAAVAFRFLAVDADRFRLLRHDGTTIAPGSDIRSRPTPEPGQWRPSARAPRGPLTPVHRRRADGGGDVAEGHRAWRET